MHSENGTRINLDFRQSGSQRIAETLTKDQRHARMLSSFQCHLSRRRKIQNLFVKNENVYILSTNLIAISDKQDSAPVRLNFRIPGHLPPRCYRGPEVAIMRFSS